MAVQIPEISSLKTWEDAFLLPIPQVRVLEQQLRTGIAGNRERLRSLVGESYRDLLSTAERIIDMDNSAQGVEEELANTARLCNSRLIAKRTKNFQSWQMPIFGNEKRRHTVAAQLALLQSCPAILANFIDKGDCLLAAKLVIITRLLLKSIPDQSRGPYVSSLGDQFVIIRRALSVSIDIQFKNPSSEQSVLLENMSAFALASSSSQSDVVRHFHSIRLNAILRLLEADALNSGLALQALRLYFKTLVDTQKLVPKQLADSLSSLKIKPLLDEPRFQNVPEINLETFGGLIPEDIRQFVPWIRHDDLQFSQVKSMVHIWAEKAMSVLLSGFEKALGALDSVEDLVKLRWDALSLCVQNQRVDVSLSEDQEGCGSAERFRKTFFTHLKKLLERRVGELEQLPITIEDLLGALHTQAEDSRGLWSESLLGRDFSKTSPATFKSAIKSKLRGSDKSLQTVCDRHTAWVQSVDSLTIIFSVMTTSKPQVWAPAQAAVVDDDEDEDLELEQLEEMNAEDSVQLGNALLTAMKEQFEALGNSFRGIITKIESNSTHVDVRVASRRCAFLLRCLREVQERPVMAVQEQIDQASLGLSALMSLRATASDLVSADAISCLATRWKTRLWREEAVPTRPIWDGELKLPTQPSLEVFQFIYDLVTAMTRFGTDIWSPDTTAVLKRRCNAELQMHSTSFIPVLLDGQAGSVAMSSDWAVQTVFDMGFLDLALQCDAKSSSGAGKDGSMSSKFVASLNGQLEQHLLDRVAINAANYWRRTFLLFALLQ